MSDDDRFDEFLRAAARDYNAPPPTPREAMWARIEEERRARATTAPAHPVAARRALWWSVAGAMAAALALGVGIGRYWAARATGTPMVASSGTRGGSGVASTVPRAAPAASTSARADAGVPDLAPVPDAGTTAAARRAMPRAASVVPAAAGTGGATDRRAYEAAALDHIGRAEALLTSFRAESKSGHVDPQVTAWAGDLLGTTRLLLDSPATEDPRLHKLLGDLEVVLAQIAQLHAQRGARSDELQLIDQAVRDHDMMSRLRTATPAGMLPAGS